MKGNGMNQLEQQEVRDTIKRLDIKHYTRTPQEDISLAQLFMTMCENGDMARCFPEYLARLGSFLQLFQTTNYLIYAKENLDIWYAFWHEPCFNGRAAWVSYWCAPHKRATRDNLDATWSSYTYLLAVYPHLFGITKQEGLLDEHTKLGYTIVSKYSKLFDENNDAWLVHLDEPAFKASKLYQLRSKAWEAEQAKAAEGVAQPLTN
jgi:hypothetical protein